MRIILLTILTTICLSSALSAQLDDKIIKELAELEGAKWQQYLHLSDYRKEKFEKLWISYERKKSQLIESTPNITPRLAKERKEFQQKLSRLFTSNELMVYNLISKMDLEDDKEFLMTIFQSIKSDTLFINDYLEFQFNQVLPRLMVMRAELEEEISTEDKIQLSACLLYTSPSPRDS